MRLTGFDGILFTALNVAQVRISTSSTPSPERQALIEPRTGADPAYAGTAIGPQRITAWFAPATGQAFEPTIQGVLSALNPDNQAARVLTATLEDGTAVETTASLEGWRSGSSVNEVLIDFVIVTPGWRETADSATALTTVSANGSIAVSNLGKRVARPLVKIGRSASGTARATKTADVGWSVMREVTITNTSTETLKDVPWQLGPLDTAALVTAGTMLSNGNDLRVYVDGREVRRNLIGANTTLTLVWIVIDSLAPGQSRTYQVAYGNASAGSPPTMTTGSTPRIPAVDTTGTTVTATSATATGVTQTAAGWETNQWAGGTILDPDGQMRRVDNNTTATIVVARAWSNIPTVGDKLVVTKSGLKGDGGEVTTATGSSLTDTSQVWSANEWVGATVAFLTGVLAGTTRTVTGNTATRLNFASLPSTPTVNLSYRVYRTNGAWLWDIRETQRSGLQRGLWVLNKGQTRPSLVDFEAPGAWHRDTYQRNNDAFSQPRATAIDVGSGGVDIDYFATMYIQRARDGKASGQTEVRMADAIAFVSPFPLIGITQGYRIRSATKANSSPSVGMATVIFGSQEPGGEEWSPYLTDEGAYNSTTAVAPFWTDLTAFGSPIRLINALIPTAADEIADDDNNTALLRGNGDYVRVELDSRGITSSVDWLTGSGTATAVYDLALQLRSGGGASATRPYSRVTVGEVGRKVLLPSAYAVWVDTDRRRVELRTAAGAFVRSLPWAVRPLAVVDGPDGVTRTLVSADWLPVTPGTVLLPNGNFTVDATGWGPSNAAATLTITRGRVASPSVGATPGAYELSVTANTSAVVTGINDASDYLPVTTNATYLLTGWGRQEQASGIARFDILWYASDLTYLSLNTVIGPSVANTWAYLSLTATAPSTAGFVRILVGANEIAAGALTKTQFDALWFGPTASDQLVHHTDPSGAGWGQVDLTYVWREGYWR